MEAYHQIILLMYFRIPSHPLTLTSHPDILLGLNSGAPLFVRHLICDIIHANSVGITSFQAFSYDVCLKQNERVFVQVVILNITREHYLGKNG